MSTGFEAVMGYLHLTDEISRLEELVAWCIQKVEEGTKIVKNIREWFPQAEVTDHPNPPVGYVAIPRAGPAMVATEGRRADRERKTFDCLVWLVRKILLPILGTNT